MKNEKNLHQLKTYLNMSFYFVRNITNKPVKRHLFTLSTYTCGEKMCYWYLERTIKRHHHEDKCVSSQLVIALF